MDSTVLTVLGLASSFGLANALNVVAPGAFAWSAANKATVIISLAAATIIYAVCIFYGLTPIVFTLTLPVGFGWGVCIELMRP